MSWKQNAALFDFLVTLSVFVSLMRSTNATCIQLLCYVHFLADTLEEIPWNLPELLYTPHWLIETCRLQWLISIRSVLFREIFILWKTVFNLEQSEFSALVLKMMMTDAFKQMISITVRSHQE